MEIAARRLIRVLEVELAVHLCAVLGLMCELDVVLVALREPLGLRLAYSMHLDSLNTSQFYSRRFVTETYQTEIAIAVVQSEASGFRDIVELAVRIEDRLDVADLNELEVSFPTGRQRWIRA